jgi:hypothetical protein
VLHIHNGDVTAELAARSGLPGRHMPFREALMSGPVPAGVPRRQWVATRLAFITEAYGVGGQETLSRLFEQEEAIDAAAGEDEIVLWFEHDLFCLVNLLYLLTRLEREVSARQVSLVWFGEWRNGRVRGLGALSGDELRLLFAKRERIAAAQYESAERAWMTYTSGDADTINRSLGDDPAFPFLGRGMTLHAARFPSLRNGLGGIEQEALDLIAGGQSDFRDLFPSFSARNSGYGMGDADFAWALSRLEHLGEPLVRSSRTEAFLDRSYEITEAGERVRQGDADNIALNGIDLWLGGIHLQSGGRVVRWDGASLKGEE